MADQYNNVPVQDEEVVDKPLCLAEAAAVLLGLLGALILISGLGFFTVNPPGEVDLCQVKTLGLQNKTKSDQDFALGTCHALYTTVFNMLHVISIPFILCGLLAMTSGFLVWKGVNAMSADESSGHFKKGICANFAGLVMVAVPAMVFPSVTAVVAAGLAPIHAYFITIMAGHFAIELSGSTANTSDPGVKAAADTYETLYLGYCAASRTELCLTVGSLSMMVLVGTYIFDILRSVAALSCYPPKIPAPGCQLCKVWKNTKDAKDAVAARYEGVAQRGNP